MPTSINTTDSIDQWILRDALRITAVGINSGQDHLIIYLNTKSQLDFPISDFPAFKDRPAAEILQYQLIGEGIGVHWPSLNEDLSLKGFLLADMKRRVG
jgi:hypothetical protein